MNLPKSVCCGSPGDADILLGCRQVAVVDDDGSLQDEIRHPIDRLDDLAEKYAGCEAAIEASGNYRPVYEMLDEQLDVTLANPSKNRLIAEATVETDRLDANVSLICAM